MIQTFSSTIRRKEMDAVLTCMVDEKIGPGEINSRLIQTVKEFFGCAGALALRSPDIALSYALEALGIEKGSKIMISVLAPGWQFLTVKNAGFEPLLLDVDSSNACVTSVIVEEGIKNGGRVLILDEPLGILPDFESILAPGIPVIEDISKSAGAIVPENQGEESSSLSQSSQTASGTFSSAGTSSGAASKESMSDGFKNAINSTKSTLENNVANNTSQTQEIKGKKAGMFGVFTICSLEERDIITAGGGALLIAPGRREWPSLKQLTENIPSIQMLPDINASLALIQFKEYKRNENARKEIFALYNRSIMTSSGKNKTFVRDQDFGSTAYSFPVILNSGVKDVKQYVSKKDVQIELAFGDCIISIIDKLNENLLEQEKLPYDYSACKNAKNLYLRTVLFPLYPRLTRSQIEKVSKVLGTLP